MNSVSDRIFQQQWFNSIKYIGSILDDFTAFFGTQVHVCQKLEDLVPLKWFVHKIVCLVWVYSYKCISVKE